MSLRYSIYKVQSCSRFASPFGLAANFDILARECAFVKCFFNYFSTFFNSLFPLLRHALLSLYFPYSPCKNAIFLYFSNHSKIRLDFYNQVSSLRVYHRLLYCDYIIGILPFKYFPPARSCHNQCCNFRSCGMYTRNRIRRIGCRMYKNRSSSHFIFSYVLDMRRS